MDMRIHDIVQPNKNVPPALDQRESDNDCGELDDQAKFKDEMQDRERSIDKRSVHKWLLGNELLIFGVNIVELNELHKIEKGICLESKRGRVFTTAPKYVTSLTATYGSNTATL